MIIVDGFIIISIFVVSILCAIREDDLQKLVKLLNQLGAAYYLNVNLGAYAAAAVSLFCVYFLVRKEYMPLIEK